MKIGLLYRNLDQGGIQKMMTNIANYLVKSGFEVYLILLIKRGEYLENLDSKVKIRTFKSSKKWGLIKSLGTIIKKENLDIVFTAAPPLNILLIITRLFYRLNVKIIISERNNTIALFKSSSFTFSKLGFLLIPFFYRFSDQIITVSKGIKDQLNRIAKIPNSKMKVIYNPAVTDDLLESINQKVDHRWLNEKKCPVLINVGRLSVAKNHKLLINAFSKVLEKINCRLIIVGEGKLREKYENLIKQLGLKDKIDLVGFQHTPAAWVSKSDLFVLSSDFEGFGNVIPEALATGITVVSTNCNFGPSEILENGKNGYLCQVNDVNDLSKKILDALKNKIDTDLQKKRANDFHVEKIMTEYLEVFSSIRKKISTNYP